MARLSGVEMGAGLQDLRPVFERTEIYSATHVHFPQSKEMWYLESTLTTMLVAAAWRSQIPAVGEVRSTRFREGARSDGRIDCVLKVEGRQVAVESKIRWFDSADGFDSVLGKLEDAESDAQSIDPAFAGQRLALCYGVIERKTDDIAGLLHSALDIGRTHTCDVIAWSLDDDGERPSGPYPGCVVVGRVVARAA